MDLWFGTSGPRDSPIAIVGESWGAAEAQAKQPFVGESGKEFERMFTEAGLNWSSCFKTNCFPIQPKDNDAYHLFYTNQEAKEKGLVAWRHLHPTESSRLMVENMYRQLDSVRPKVVLAIGNYALWALTEHYSVSNLSLGNGVTINVPSGIMSWRGSMTYSVIPSTPPIRLIPLIHPANILRAWYNRACTVHDLRERVPQALQGDWRRTKEKILAPPTFDEAVEGLQAWLIRLREGPLRLVADIETHKRLITVMGFSDAPDFALVIPFVQQTSTKGLDSYWTPEQEVELLRLIRKIFLHPNLLLEGQNFIYDTQYIYKYLGVLPRLDFDSMLAHHLLFPGTPKGLDYLSSLYARYHRYWKDEGKNWDTKRHGFLQLLQYNAIDVMRTYECTTVLREEIIKSNLSEQWEWEKKKASLALRMMLRGINVDRSARSRIGFELHAAQANIHRTLEQIIPGDIAHSVIKSKRPWYASPKQTLHVFYDILGLPGQRHRKTGNPTVDDEALTNLKKKAPEFARIFALLSGQRSIDVFSSNFLSAPLDSDGRMRCSFNPAGTETFRWSSSENAFGGGTNLQNVPKGTED